MRVETEYEVEDSSDDCGVLWLGSPDYNEFVIGIKEECEMELVGRKAYNILLLAMKGFPVPDGFCVTTRAYDYFLDFNGIDASCRDICERMEKGRMPPPLIEAIRQAYGTYLYGKPCAVRSSSPLEDTKRASFAGQYESFLNISDLNSLLDAVKKCWISLWQKPAVEYRKKMEIKTESLRMAVLVQEMLSPTASGVLFTDDVMIIEAIWGLGDILVGGRIVPDHYVIEKTKLRVIERNLSQKSLLSHASPSGGLEVVDVPENLASIPALTDEEIRELCVLGLKIEKYFGCPQDIEWVLSNGKFILTQTRPISVKPLATVWSRANVAETQPGYVTYLSRIPENRPDDIVLGLRPLLEQFGLGDVPDDIKFREYIYGHLYLNMTTVHETLGSIPGLSPEVLDQSLGHSASEGEEPETKMGISSILRLLPGTLRVIRLFLSLNDQARKVIPCSRRMIAEIREKDLEKANLQQLEELVWSMYEWNSQVFQVHSVTALAVMAMFGVVQKFTERIGEEGIENVLTVGLEGMSSSQMALELWNLAQSAKESSIVTEIILSRTGNVIGELRKSFEGVAFLKEMDRFMDEYGDRCSQEMELSVPRWEENPCFVLSMAANYLDSGVDPMRIMEEQKEIRVRETERILKKLSKNPIEKLLFEKFLEKTQEYIVMRENLKTTWTKGISVQRLLYLRIAQILVETGILEKEGDIFFLKMTEVSDIISGNFDQWQITQKIKERKKEKEVYEYVDVPEVIIGKPPKSQDLECFVESKARLEGIGCSHGIVTGRAKVVLDPTLCTDFKEGDILVAPITDPGWSPLFITAGGLVMELGGTLSHGVIIAREYGIPAVVGVKNATKIIKSGQRITIDGSRGTINIGD